MRIVMMKGWEAASGLCRSTPTAVAAKSSPHRYHHEEGEKELVVVLVVPVRVACA
jgi:hypothetical protein